jgi:hypothetical protein
MGLVARLNQLDRRVLGPVRPQSALQHRNVVLIGLGGLTALLIVALLTRRASVLVGFGGFMGVLLGGGLRWYSAASMPEERRFMRPLFGTAAVVVLVLIAAFTTSGRWDHHQRFRDFTPGRYFQRPDPTMVVLCPETADGRAYTYQAPAAQTPTCRNGAVPKVVVRG